MSTVRSAHPWYYASARKELFEALVCGPIASWGIISLITLPLVISRIWGFAPVYASLIILAIAVAFFWFPRRMAKAEVHGKENLLVGCAIGPMALLLIGAIPPWNVMLLVSWIAFFLAQGVVAFYCYHQLAYLLPIRSEVESWKRNGERQIGFADKALALLDSASQPETAQPVVEAPSKPDQQFAEIINSGKEPSLIVEQLRQLVESK